MAHVDFNAETMDARTMVTLLWMKIWYSAASRTCKSGMISVPAYVLLKCMSSKQTNCAR